MVEIRVSVGAKALYHYISSVLWKKAFVGGAATI